MAQGASANAPELLPSQPWLVARSQELGAAAPTPRFLSSLTLAVPSSKGFISLQRRRVVGTREKAAFPSSVSLRDILAWVCKQSSRRGFVSTWEVLPGAGMRAREGRRAGTGMCLSLAWPWPQAAGVYPAG